MAPWPAITLAGGVVGGLMGLFGVGGSSVATPVLSLLGVPPLVAVGSALVATIPGAATAAVPHVRSSDARPKAAGGGRYSVAGPATVVGALLSRLVGGPALLIASRLVLLIVGVRVLLPIEDAAPEAGTRRRQNLPLLVASAAGLGLLTRVAGCYQHVQQDRRLVRRHACPWHPPSARLRRGTLAVRRGVGSFDVRSASGR